MKNFFLYAQRTPIKIKMFDRIKNMSLAELEDDINNKYYNNLLFKLFIKLK